MSEKHSKDNSDVAAVSKIPVFDDTLETVEDKSWLIVSLIVVFFFQELHKVITTKYCWNTWLSRAVTFCQPGYSAEKKFGAVFIFFK